MTRGANTTGNPNEKGNRTKRVSEQIREEVAPRQKATRIAQADAGRDYAKSGANKNQDVDAVLNEPDSRVTERQPNAPRKRTAAKRTSATRSDGDASGDSGAGSRGSSRKSGNGRGDGADGDANRSRSTRRAAQHANADDPRSSVSSKQFSTGTGNASTRPAARGAAEEAERDAKANQKEGRPSRENRRSADASTGRKSTRLEDSNARTEPSAPKGARKAASSRGAIEEGASGRTTATRKKVTDNSSGTAAAPRARKSDQGSNETVARSGHGPKHPGSGNKRPPKTKGTDIAPTETTPRAGPGSAPPARRRQG